MIYSNSIKLETNFRKEVCIDLKISIPVSTQIKKVTIIDGNFSSYYSRPK